MRIYPAFWVVVLLSIFASYDYSITHSVKMFLFLGANGSLFQEIAISSFFPLIYTLLYKKLSNQSAILIAAAFYFVGVFPHHYIHNDICCIPYYTSFFLMGIILYKNKDSLANFANNKFLVLAVFFYAIRFFSFGLVKSEAVFALLSGLSSVIIILSSFHNVYLKRILSNKVMAFLGIISYSVFLSHNISLAFVSFMLSKFLLSPFSIAVIAILFSVPFSYVLHKAIEVPFIKLSRKIQNKLCKTEFQISPGNN